MKALEEYFENTKGMGVIATADGEGTKGRGSLTPSPKRSFCPHITFAASCAEEPPVAA